MKKWILFFTIAVMSISFMGCRSSKEETNTTMPQKTVSQPDETASIKEAIDYNILLLNHENGLKTLPHNENPIKDNLYPVVSDEFKSVADIRSKLSKYYIEDAVNIIMDKVNLMYKDVDGVLCFDQSGWRGKGYFVDWSHYEMKTGPAGDGMIQVTLTADKTEPGENVSAVPYQINVVLVKDDGNWKLTQWFH